MSQTITQKRIDDFFSTTAPLRVIGFSESESETTLMRRHQLDSQFRCLDKQAVLFFAKSVLKQESMAILQQISYLSNDFCRAVSLILNTQGNVVVSGMGKAGHIGRKIAATFASTGTPSHFMHPAEAIHGDLGMLSPNDVILILSNSGETEEVVRLLPSLQKMAIPILAITTQGSSLAKASEIVLEIEKMQEADANNLAPSTSTTVMLAVGDALALTVSQQKKFRAEDFARFHPGGSLGRKLCNVEEQMRPISQCRIAFDQKTVREIFTESHIPGRRSGAILLVNADFQLTGIFTDSDLAKLFEKGGDFFDRPVCELMTKSPKTVLFGTKMSEAVTIMGNYKISELPVLKQDGIPIGLLDITDLVAFFPEENELPL